MSLAPPKMDAFEKRLSASIAGKDLDKEASDHYLAKRKKLAEQIKNLNEKAERLDKELEETMNQLEELDLEKAKVEKILHKMHMNAEIKYTFHYKADDDAKEVVKELAFSSKTRVECKNRSIIQNAFNIHETKTFFLKKRTDKGDGMLCPVVALAGAVQSTAFDVLICPEGKFQINVKCPGGETVEATVEPDTTVKALKAQLAGKPGVPAGDYRMFMMQFGLADPWIMADVHILDGSTLEIKTK